MYVNPSTAYTLAVKKHLSQALPKTYTESIDQCVDRIMHSMATKQDVESLMKLFNALYYAGYNNAFDAVDKTLKEHNLKLKLSRPNQN